jgi:hypothetical protein
MPYSPLVNVREQQQNAPAPAWLAVVKSHVEKTRFGAVQVIIHDGRIVRVERTEKVLFEPAIADQT